MMIKRITTLFLIVFFLSGCQDNFVGGNKEVIEEEILADYQDKLFEDTGEYKHVPEYKKGKFTYRVDEYLKPNGNRGYQIIVCEKKAEDGKYCKSNGKGKMKTEKSYELKKIEDYTIKVNSNNATST